MNDPSFPERVLLAIAQNRSLDRWAMRAILKANELLGLALGVRLAALRDAGEPLQAAFAQAEANLLLAKGFEEVARILGLRWDKISDKHRPQYTPEQRYRILRLKKLLCWSSEQTARLFRISVNTVNRWERESRTDGDSPPRLVRTTPPVRRFADVVRELVHTMRFAGFGGYKTIAQTLARAGARISTRTIARILREERPPKRAVEIHVPSKRRAVTASFPNHVFLIDLTDIPSLFGLFKFKLALILDLFSRFPVAARVFPKEPGAHDIARLFDHAVRRFGPPRYLVSDQGSQMTSDAFRSVLKRLGVRHRFGAIGKVGSIAPIERFWRTLKKLLAVRSFPPLVQSELERRVELALRFYALCRPHQGLAGATPSELYFGLAPLPRRAPLPLPLPRGRPGEGAMKPLFNVEFLDSERRFPVLANVA